MMNGGQANPSVFKEVMLEVPYGRTGWLIDWMLGGFDRPKLKFSGIRLGYVGGVDTSNLCLTTIWWKLCQKSNSSCSGLAISRQIRTRVVATPCSMSSGKLAREFSAYTWTKEQEMTLLFSTMQSGWLASLVYPSDRGGYVWPSWATTETMRLSQTILHGQALSKNKAVFAGQRAIEIIHHQPNQDRGTVFPILCFRISSFSFLFPPEIGIRVKPMVRALNYP
eukprot:scaffold4870_cov135-Cylindrotheca_fusiformis.AAC.1